MLTRAYSLLQIKSIDADQRIIEGYASTPELDRQGDVLESRGAQFKLPMPLLWQHDKTKPIGHVVDAQVSDHGIRIKAQIARNVLPYIDEAWALIKAGLVGGLSVGWRPIDMPKRRKDGGLQFSKWMWAETSAVTIPANASASIDLLKSLDASVLSNTGARESSNLPAAVGATPKARTMTQNPGHLTYSGAALPVADQLSSATAELKTKSARLEELVLKDGAEGGLETEEATERDMLSETVEKLSSRVKNLRAIENAQAAMATPVLVRPSQGDVRDIRQQTHQVEVKSNLEPGIEFARYVICQMAALKTRRDPLTLAKENYPDCPRIQWMIKDNVPAGTTQDNLFASPLVQRTTLAGEFLEWLRPQTIIGRIPGLRRVPFNVRITGQSSGATGYWVGEGQAKPLTRYGFNATTLTWAKVAAIIAITDELARFSVPSAEALVRDEIAAALLERLDIDFVDPTKAAVANVSPASITNGVTNLNDTGATLANTMTDIAQFFNAMISNNFDISQCVWIMPNTVAMQLALMRDATGALAFPTMSVSGGTWQGLPVVASQHLLFSHTPANNKVILVHAPSIAVSDDGGFTIDVSREASLEMDDQPVMASTSAAGSPSGPTGSALVSMFQTNSIAIRCERYINWARLRTGAVVWMDDVRWAA